MSFTPTDEQVAAVDAFTSGSDLIVEAGAGTGKTSTLRAMATTAPHMHGQYVAFNKSIVTEASAKFPGSVSCNTAHSLAFRAIGRRYAHRLNGPRMRPDELADLMGIDPLVVDIGGGRSKRLASGWMAGVVMRAVTNFCQSAATAPGRKHFQYVDGIDMPRDDGSRTYANNDILREHLSGALKDAWADILDPQGHLPYKHEHYLKTWQLDDPVIGADFILFDEAQDANPVILAIVEAQTHAQRIFVGDTQQQIYEWTGAVNAMSQLDVAERTFLTRSFRFGQAIADKANEVLAMLEADLRLTGNDQIPSTIGSCSTPSAILARTNATAVRRTFEALADGGKPHLIGGGTEVVSFARAAKSLQEKHYTSHPELACFSSWEDVQDYVRHDEQGHELRLLVTLVDDFGADQIVEKLARMASEKNASVVVSTAHKAKGREWPSVALADDFPDPETFKAQDREIEPGELRLAYVALTRAQERLDVDEVPLLGGRRKAPVVELGGEDD